MSRTLYLPPVSRLIALGDPNQYKRWPDYPSFGINQSHIDELIRMAGDEDLHRRASDDPAIFAPIHAWMALGMLRAEQAIHPLISQLARIDKDNDDWASEELPYIFGMIGPACIEALATYTMNDAHGEYARTAAARGLREIAFVWPDSRLNCADALQKCLTQYATNLPSLNGFLISNLVDVAPADSIPLIEEAFRAGRVDETIMGNLDDVRKHVREKLNLQAPVPMLSHSDVQKMSTQSPDPHAA